MSTQEEEICGAFVVENEDHKLMLVVVIQDSLSHYSKEESYSKTLRLGSLDGVSVFRTEDPKVFQLANGATLRKRRR